MRVGGLASNDVLSALPVVVRSVQSPGKFAFWDLRNHATMETDNSFFTAVLLCCNLEIAEVH